MEAALGVAEQGYQTYLVEKTAELGGVALRLRSTWKGEEVGAYVQDLIQEVQEHPEIQVFLETEVKDTTGIIGNFTTTLASANGKSSTSVVEHGATILATGGKEFKSEEYLYGGHPGIMTHLDLDEALLKRDARVKEANTAVFIQCVGSRIPERPYCSKICCTHSLESALTLKEMNPEMDIFILYRDLRSYGFREDLYREARKKGVIFIRYSFDSTPQITAQDSGSLSLDVLDHVLGKTIRLSPDLVILATAILPNENKELFEKFKVPINDEGFLIEAHMKLRPVDFSTDGIFVCGIAHYPKPFDECIAQAQASASRAVTILAQEGVVIEPIVAAFVDRDACRGCGLCVALCPYGALEIEETTEGRKVKLISASCKGCGICAATCYQHAVSINAFSDTQIEAQMHAFLDQ
jgi:heterodisulfide reductase subunit A